MTTRIIIAIGDRTESTAVAEWLAAEGLEPVAVRTMAGAIQELQARPCDLLIADETFAFDPQLTAVPRMRSAPLVVIGDSTAGERAARRNAAHVARPVDRALLMCHVAMAVAEPRPERRSARKRIAPVDAIVEGGRARVIEVSDDGLRLELLPGRRTVPPPYFVVRLPLIGVALPVRRVWMSTRPGAGTALCGAALHQVPPRAERNWRAFVDVVPHRPADPARPVS